MLEIGYGEGASAHFWEKYFPNAEVFVMDVGVCGRYSRHEVLMGDQSNILDLERVSDRIGSVKFIIDDGSHQPNHQYDTFEYLFNFLLEPGGVYIIEDIECNYWKSDSEVYGYKIGNFNSVKKTTELIDFINSEFSGKKNDWGISSITYGQNCVIITKQTEEERLYFNRPYRFSDCLGVPVITKLSQSDAKLLNNDIYKVTNSYIKDLIGTLTRTFHNGGPIEKWKFIDDVYNKHINYYSMSEERFGGYECWPFEADSMIGVYRMVNIYEAIKYVVRNGIEGDFVETGVWKGGACVLANASLHEMGQESVRRVHLFDSFEGLPIPYMEQDNGDKHYTLEFLRVDIEYVKGVFEKYGYLTDNVVFRKGFFSDTMKETSDIEKISILRLDGDMYSSTIEVLNALYHKLSSGGIVIVDDWTLDGAKNAVIDFRNKIGETLDFLPIDNHSCYWIKK